MNNGRRRDLRSAVKGYVTDVIRSGVKPSVLELKDGFKAANPATVDSVTAELVDEALVKIIGEVLRGLVTLDGEHHQLKLPLDLGDLNLDGVISFIDPRGVNRWTDIAQATGAEVESHLAIMAEQVQAITTKYQDLRTLWNRIRHLMVMNPVMTVAQALEILTKPPEGGIGGEATV